MAGYRQNYRDQRSESSTSGNLGNGVCMINNSWRDEQCPNFIHFISSFLRANAYRLNFLPITPDFIFNNGGLSVAFIFITKLEFSKYPSSIWQNYKVEKPIWPFFTLLPLFCSTEQNESFINSYFKYGIEIGKPTFIIVDNLEMGFEKIVKIAYVKGESKRKDVISKLKAEVMEAYVNVITAIPGLDNHDANALIGSIGSIEALSKASREFIMENSDLSAEKAELIENFFRDPKYYFSPKIN